MPGRGLSGGVDPDWLVPSWRARGVGGLMTTRAGGGSVGPWASMNVGVAVGDDVSAVAANRAHFARACGAEPVWLRQVHGVRVARIGRSDVGAEPHEADAAVTAESGIACVVQVADCLPVLFAACDGRAVGAAHAGWRGLAAGILERTIAELASLAHCGPSEIEAWLGPSIGPDAFEVGDDVVAAFAAAGGAPEPARFRPGRAGRWQADLPGLARDRLTAAGVARVGGNVDGGDCTVAAPSRFFSFRRDGVCGRMAAAVWIEAAR